MTEPEYLNAQQAGRYLGLTRQRIYALSKAGKLGRHVAGFWLYTPAELDAWRASSSRRGGRPKHPAGPLPPVVPATAQRP
ncbi:MAG: hypothetical protein NVS2B7_36790 [Herpetosiphon sp.]